MGRAADVGAECWCRRALFHWRHLPTYLPPIRLAHSIVKRQPPLTLMALRWIERATIQGSEHVYTTLKTYVTLALRWVQRATIHGIEQLMLILSNDVEPFPLYIGNKVNDFSWQWQTNPGPGPTPIELQTKGPLDGLYVAQSHGKFVAKVKKGSKAYKQGIRTGTEFLIFGEERLNVSSATLSQFRDYIKAITIYYRRFKVILPGQKSRKCEDQRRVSLTQLMKNQREGQTVLEQEEDNEKARLRMESSRSARSPEEQALDNEKKRTYRQHNVLPEDEKKRKRVERGGSPSTTPSSKRDQDRMQARVEREFANFRFQPAAPAVSQETDEPEEIPMYTVPAEGEEALVGADGRERQLVAVDEEASALTWQATIQLFASDHDELLSDSSAIPLTIMERFSTGLHFETAVGGAEIWPSTFFSYTQNNGAFDLPLLPPTQAETSIAIVRFGATATSGHFVVLAAKPGQPGKVKVYDSLYTYTLESEYSRDYYLPYLQKVGAVLQRGSSTRGVELSFVFMGIGSQQSTGSNACGAYAALYSVALLLGISPAKFVLDGRKEVVEKAARWALHQAVYGYLDNGTAMDLQSFQNLVMGIQSQAGYVEEGDDFNALCPICRDNSSTPAMNAANPTPPRRHLPQTSQRLDKAINDGARKARPGRTGTPLLSSSAPPAQPGRYNTRSKSRPPPPPSSRPAPTSAPPAPVSIPPTPPSPSIPTSAPPTDTPTGRPIPKLPSRRYRPVLLKKLKRPGLPDDAASRCPFCHTSLFEGEAGSSTAVSTQWCCAKGQKLIPALIPIRAPFHDSEAGFVQKEYLDNIRTLNGCFALAKLRVAGTWVNPRFGTSNVKVHGRIMHKVADLDWTGQHGPRESQLVIFDGQERERVARSHRIHPVLMNDINDYLNNHCSFYREYQRLASHPSETARLCFEQTSRRTHGPILGDMPFSDEIAGIIDDSSEGQPRSAYILKKGERYERKISVLNPEYDPLSFPLLFPHGDAGWSTSATSTIGKSVTLNEYVRQLFLREPRFTQLGRLAQEFAVDSFCRMEELRLNYFRTPEGQARLRQGTREEVATRMGEQSEDGPAAGRVYLPASFTGGPRYMRQLFHDGMACVARLGRPNLFVTFTCNPKWEEIQPAGDPAITNRVFKLKFQILIEDLRKGRIFNLPQARYYLSVIEFQKRGLPHSHTIVCFGRDLSVEEVDSIVRADIPGEDEPELRELVLKHMIHGPCGHRNPNSPCMDHTTNSCGKLYPKDACDATYVDERGFVVYRRPCLTSATITRGGKEYVVTDLDAVPYCPALLIRYGAHLNVEIANTNRSVKYLFKYAYKGQDRVKSKIVEDGQPAPPVNEIHEYENNRLLSASEALWRIFNFQVQWRSPAVKAVAVHLPGRDWLVFQEGDPTNALRKTSEMTRYLNRPQLDEFDDLTLCAYYERFREVNAATRDTIPHPDRIHHLLRRTHSTLIVRLHWITGLPGELFFLRLLLYRFPTRSYEGLRTVDGTIHGTFQETARAHGLLADDDEFIFCLKEASVYTLPNALRALYVVMIVANSGAASTFSSRQIWDELRKELSDEPENPNSEASWDAAYNKALIDIRRRLSRHRRTLEDEGLPGCTDTSTEYGREEERWADSKERLISEVHEWLPKLNQEQRALVDAVLSSFPAWARIQWPGQSSKTATDSSPKGQGGHRTIYLDAPGGCGKTAVMKFLTAHLRSLGFTVACMASTGIAALNYEGGITAHSMVKLPIDPDPKAVCNISMGSQRAELLRNTSLFIWDEFPNVHKDSFASFRRLLEDLRSPITQVCLLAGDFRQIPPVIKYGSKRDVLRASVKFDAHFQEATCLQLTENIRARQDPPYADFVLTIGNGTAPTIPITSGKATINAVPCPLIRTVPDIEALIRFVYPNLDEPHIHGNMERAILAGTNEKIDEINRRVMTLLPGDWTSLYSADSAHGDDGEPLHVSPEVLNICHDVGVPPHDLRLKLNTIAIITRNLSFDSRLVNSTKVIIRSISPSKRLVSVGVLNPVSGEEERFPIPRITFKFKAGTKGMEIERRQFPLRPAFSMTFNKAQGKTLSVVGVCLEEHVFSHGQAYVALSRVRKRGDIRLLVHPDFLLKNVPHILNIFFPELLKDVEEHREEAEMEEAVEEEEARPPTTTSPMSRLLALFRSSPGIPRHQTWTINVYHVQEWGEELGAVDAGDMAMDVAHSNPPVPAILASHPNNNITVVIPNTSNSYFRSQYNIPPSKNPKLLQLQDIGMFCLTYKSRKVPTSLL